MCVCALLAGGHLLEEEPLLLLKWRLGGSLLSTLSAALAEDGVEGSQAAAADEDAGSAAAGCGTLGSKLSEKGVLQLLFDVRFLMDLLSGSRPVSTAAG